MSEHVPPHTPPPIEEEIKRLEQAYAELKTQEVLWAANRAAYVEAVLKECRRMMEEHTQGPSAPEALVLESLTSKRSLDAAERYASLIRLREEPGAARPDHARVRRKLNIFR